MALVDYSDSDSDSAQSLDDHGRKLVKPELKRRRIGDVSERRALSDLPPLPAGFHDLYASASRASSGDDPSLHGGRQRLRPHVEGNWPTHVYLECKFLNPAAACRGHAEKRRLMDGGCPTHAESNHLSNLISGIKAASQDEPAIHSLLDSDLGTQLPLHVSLSQPVVLVTQQRDRFAELLEESIKQSGVRPYVKLFSESMTRLANAVFRFEVSFTSLDWVPNNGKTRWFLVSRLEKPTDDGLNRMLRISNHVLGSFGQPPLYAEREPEVRPSVRDDGSRRGLHGNQDTRSEGRFHKQPSNLVSKKDDPDLSSHFHISTGWSLEKPPAEVLELTRTADLSVLLSIKVRFEAVKLKIGNAVTVVPLPREVGVGKGLIGL